MTSLGTNAMNRSPYLRTSRDFPPDPVQMAIEINKSYLDIARVVNSRTIGIFSTNAPTVTGEAWFFNGEQKQQTLRQIYYITSPTSFNHNLNWNSIQFFTKIYAIFFDGTNYYPVPFVNNTATGQVEIYVSPTQVVISFGGATPPGFVSGIVILEWLTNV